jgi:hypothetical protein
MTGETDQDQRGWIQTGQRGLLQHKTGKSGYFFDPMQTRNEGADESSTYSTGRWGR